MSDRHAAVPLLVLVAALAAALPAAARPNPHNSQDCLFCHREAPKFGVDTRETVTYVGPGADDPGLCLRCHKPEENLHPLGVKPGAQGTAAPKNLPLATAAGREGTVVCTTCHFVHAAFSDFALLRGFPGSQDPKGFRGWQDLCRECHGASLEKRSPHAGDERACAFCHQATPRKGQPVAVAPRAEKLCNFCHGGLQNEHYAASNPFGADARCLTCHDPHLGPDRPGRIRPSFLDAARATVTVSPHYLRTFCTACHTEEKTSPLVENDDVKLCNRCHASGRIPADPHPMAAVPAEFKVPQDWPLKGGSLTCLTCHTAGHREERGRYRFLRGGPYQDRNEICFRCHTKEEFARRNPHQDIGQMRGCEFCHSVRPVPGKDSARTVKLVADAVLLCLRCHEYVPHPAAFQHTVKPDAAWAARIPAEMPLDADGEIVCSTCHNPHIAEVGEYKLRGEMGAMGLCGRCHVK